MGDPLTQSGANGEQESLETLRVLVFTTAFPNPAQALHGSFVLERVRRLAHLADVQVVAPVEWRRAGYRGVPTSEMREGISVAHPRFWYIPRYLKPLDGFFLFASSLGRIRRLRRFFDFDLIDAHFAYPDGFAAILLGRWFRRPVCITLRGTIIPLSVYPLRRRLCDWAIRRAERVIAVSENLAERARQGGVPQHRMATIPNGVDSERFRLVDRTASRRHLGLPENGRLLVSVGHLSPRKGFHRVIRSLPRLVRACPDIRFAIVGGRGVEPDNGAELRDLARRLGIADRVLLVGPQAPERVALWLGAADVFVLASDFEGCPNVVMEAMACGRPVVATKVGDIERMVPPFAGILVDGVEDEALLADALGVALTREWNLRRIRDHAAAQSWDKVARRVAAEWLLVRQAFAVQSGDPAALPVALQPPRGVPSDETRPA